MCQHKLVSLLFGDFCVVVAVAVSYIIYYDIQRANANENLNILSLVGENQNNVSRRDDRFLFVHSFVCCYVSLLFYFSRNG